MDGILFELYFALVEDFVMKIQSVSENLYKTITHWLYVMLN